VHFEEKSEKVKFGKTFADYKMKVFEIPDHKLQPGAYEVNFTF